MAKNETMIKWIRIAFIAGSILVTVAIAYATLDVRLNHAVKTVDATVVEVNNNGDAIIRLQTDVSYIKKDVSEIKDGMKEQKTLSVKILEELKK